MTTQERILRNIIVATMLNSAAIMGLAIALTVEAIAR